MVKKVGVLALQGAFSKHIEMITSVPEAQTEAFEVRHIGQLNDCQALIIPGGESTVICKLLKSYNLIEPIRKFIKNGSPVWGTCAGMILLASDVKGKAEDQFAFGSIQIAVERNGYGRQQDSFEALLKVSVLGEKPFKGVFIRAPKVTSVDEEVTVLASMGDESKPQVPVLCRQNNVLVSSFHPELTDDLRLHKYFINMVV